MIISSCRRVVIILDIEVLHPASDIPGVIGNPVAYNEGKSLEHILKYCGCKCYPCTGQLALKSCPVNGKTLRKSKQSRDQPRFLIT